MEGDVSVLAPCDYVTALWLGSWPALFREEVQIEPLVQTVSAESKQRGGTVLTDLQTRDRSHWLDWTLILWPKQVRGLGELVAVAVSERRTGVRVSGSA